jgi:hypothetical protein
MIVDAKMRRENGPPRRSREGRTYLVCRVPYHGEDAVVVLAGGAAEIGVELARSELGCCEHEAHIVLAAFSPRRIQPAPISTLKSGWVERIWRLACELVRSWLLLFASRAAGPASHGRGNASAADPDSRIGGKSQI